MFQTVELPLWLLVLAFLLAAIAAAERVIGPSLRWLFRRRLERVLARVNQKLDRKIEPFKLMRRQDMVIRLLYDPAVLEAVAEHAAANGLPGEVALEEARRYAREIVPGFSALFYFGFATRAARAISDVAFRLSVRQVNPALSRINPKATIIFVINHRSNMDYVLVTWLVSARTAISYAVGEWARVWPLSALIRAMGAYFIRRGSRNPLYRRVLARYVQMITAEGQTQAIFLEGGLSLNGRVGGAKMGLLSYVTAGFEPASGRDVVFVPVGLAYDRVLEDRLLVGAAQQGDRRFRPRLLRILAETLMVAVKRAGGRRHLYGAAAASFGAPVSLAQHLAAGGGVEDLGARLMAEIAKGVPVLPVPLVAASLRSGRDLESLVGDLRALGVILPLPSGGLAALDASGRAGLRARGILSEEGTILAGQEPMADYYAAAVMQHLERQSVEGGLPPDCGALPDSASVTGFGNAGAEGRLAQAEDR